MPAWRSVSINSTFSLDWEGELSAVWMTSVVAPTPGFAGKRNKDWYPQAAEKPPAV